VALAGLALAVLAGEARAQLPAEHPDPALRELWAEGLALERREELIESSRRYERLAERLPASAFVRWRLARNYWRHGERLPVEARRDRLLWFEQAERWASAALVLDARCGECVLWKLASLGRIATTAGVWQAAGMASRIAELIDLGLELRPTHVDNPDNVELANLYYAGAAFYRVVPDWWWLTLAIGVRGDNHRALDYIQKAIAISGSRLDYRVELGAVLLCIGSDEEDPARVEEGRRVLAQAMALPDFQSTDRFDREHARVLATEPERACGYSRDGWIDLEEAARKRREASLPRG
jgi:hypothetical protein